MNIIRKFLLSIFALLALTAPIELKCGWQEIKDSENFNKLWNKAMDAGAWCADNPKATIGALVLAATLYGAKCYYYPNLGNDRNLYIELISTPYFLSKDRVQHLKFIKNLFKNIDFATFGKPGNQEYTTTTYNKFIADFKAGALKKGKKIFIAGGNILDNEEFVKELRKEAEFIERIIREKFTKLPDKALLAPVALNIDASAYCKTYTCFEEFNLSHRIVIEARVLKEIYTKFMQIAEYEQNLRGVLQL